MYMYLYMCFLLWISVFLGNKPFCLCHWLVSVWFGLVRFGSDSVLHAAATWEHISTCLCNWRANQHSLWVCAWVCMCVCVCEYLQLISFASPPPPAPTPHSFAWVWACNECYDCYSNFPFAPFAAAIAPDSVSASALAESRRFAYVRSLSHCCWCFSLFAWCWFPSVFVYCYCSCLAFYIKL